MIQQYDEVVAVFEPKPTHDLRPGADSAIGRTGVFVAVWLIEDGPRVGEWAMRAPVGWPFAWCPYSDLKVLDS